MSIRNSFSRYRTYIRQHGFAIALALGTHRLLNRLGEHYGLYWYRFYRQPLAARTLQLNKSNLDFVWLDHYESILEQLPRPRQNIQSRFDQGVKCLTAIKQNELIACAWFGFEKFKEDEVRCTYLLPGDSVWDFDIYVFPRYRIGRFFLRTWQEANDKLSREGFLYSLSRISAYNNRSIRSHENLGASRIGNALFLKLSAVQIMFATLPPYIFVTCSRNSAPSINFERVL